MIQLKKPSKESFTSKSNLTEGRISRIKGKVEDQDQISVCSTTQERSIQKM